MKYSLRNMACMGLFLYMPPALAQTTQLLQADFVHPPKEARPQVWWHWMHGNISKEGIYKDLTWMHRVGISGFHLFDAGLSTPCIVPERVKYMTPAWKDCFRYSLHLADSLGMSVAIPSSPGWSNTGGPWVKPEDAMKKVTWQCLRLRGGRKVTVQLPPIHTTTGRFQNNPEADLTKYTCAREIAVIAVRLPKEDIDIRSLQPTVTASKGDSTLEGLTDGDVAQSVRIEPDSEGKLYVQYTFRKPITIKALSMADGRIRSTWNSWGAPVLYQLEASDDGKAFRKVCDIPQGGTSQHTLHIPTTKARCFRLVCNTPETDKKNKAVRFMNLQEWVLYTTERINFAEGKAGFTSFGDLDAYPSAEEKAVPALSDVVDITDKVDAQGVLHWKAPAGNWRIYRFGWSLIGKKNGPATPESTGLEVDKLDKAATQRFFEYYLAMYDEASGGLLGPHGVSHFLIDSYEASNQTWTPSLPQEFERRRGYSIYGWLPVLTGQMVGSMRQSEQFLYDYRQTIGELIEENLYGQAAVIAGKYGMKTYFESHENGRQMLGDGISIKAKADIPMGAMWAEQRADLSMYECDLRESASTAHIYGKRYVAGEAFTADGRQETCYTFYPGNLKPIADYMMGCGLNRFVIHESAHQPVDDKKPGLALAIYGQWFNRHETWAEQAKAWTDYLARSSYMLQQGNFVADIAYYYGTDNSVNGRFGHQHPAIPKGYSFDYVNPASLIDVFDFNGRVFTTKSGMTYRLLVIDPHVSYMRVEELRKLAALAKAGAPILGQRPSCQPNLMGDNAEWQRLVAEIWDKGRTNVMEGTDISAALASLQLRPDVGYAPQDSVRWVHRHTADADIYWVANARNEPLCREFTFRTSGRRPECWQAEDGRVEAVSYRMEGGDTHVQLNLQPYEAVFIVFKEKTTESSYTVAPRTETPVLALNDNWTIRFGKVQDTPEEVTVDKLKSYTEFSDEHIRYFSGTATYTKQFSVSQHLDGKSRYKLDLGRVGCMAEVRLNGQYIGTLWKAPYTIDITEALKQQDNLLEIKVVNLWVNRVIGDKQRGIAKKYTWASYNGAFRSTSALQPSGLLGPVQILQQQ